MFCSLGSLLVKEMARGVGRDEEGEIMGIRHKTFPLEGVQYHPESFLTLEGTRLLKNFLDGSPPVAGP